MRDTSLLVKKFAKKQPCTRKAVFYPSKSYKTISICFVRSFIPTLS